jgi:uncharacterized damage-inducible protein DinB
MSKQELETFLNTWERESQVTRKLLEALPADQYDLRPDAGGRSLGELAWHLTECEAFISDGVARGKFEHNAKLPIPTRPREVPALAPGFAKAHDEAVERVRRLAPADLDRTLDFFGREFQIRELLWTVLLHHSIHHRGQLALMCRIGGGECPGIYGPNREETAALRARAAATA